MMLLSDRRNLHVAIILPLQDRPERYRHGFTGKEYDSWTGLYNYGFRDYSAMFGRFTTVDPIQDGHNWYAYVNSDPVSWLDPWGLCPTDAESGADSARGTGDRFDWEKYAEKINQEKQVYFNAHVNEWDGSRMGETAVIPPFTRVSNAAENHLGERYKDGNTCDEWTAKVLTEASFSPSDYYLGDTSQTVKQHIDELKSNGGDYSATSNSSAYVVFMGDGTRDYSVGHEHAGLLVIDSTGNVNFYHSSQGNEGKLSAMESYSSVSAFEKDFAYSSFYYQEVR